MACLLVTMQANFAQKIRCQCRGSFLLISMSSFKRCYCPRYCGPLSLEEACGAPHYHRLLWIKDVSIISKDSPEKVASWIDERITC